MQSNANSNDYLNSNDQESSIVTVTPKMAANWLAKNKKNRTVAKGRVIDYANRLRDGKWMLNGESIKFDTNGNVLDGQHRLHAVIKSGVSMVTHVVNNIPPEVFKTLDGGKPRSGADALHIIGYKNAALLSGGIRFIMRIKSGLSTRNSSIGRQGANHNIDVIDEINFIAKNKHLQDWTAFVEKLSKSGGASISLGKTAILGFLYLFSEKDKEQAEEFITKLCFGIGLEIGDPIWLLRDRLLKVASSPTMILPTNVRNALVIKAWNAFRTGNYPKQLKYTSGETFPKIM